MLQVEEPLYRLGIDLREEPVAKMRKIVQPDIVFISVLRRPHFGGHLQFAVLLDEAAKGDNRFRTVAVAVNVDENLSQLAFGLSLGRNVFQEAEFDGLAYPFHLARFRYDILAVERLPPDWISILTEPDSAGLKSPASQFEALSVDSGNSVGWPPFYR